MTKRRNNSIDILRLAAAFFIICLHNFSGSGVQGGEETVALARFAVPMFFLFSGYFSANFDNKRKARQLVRILAWGILGNLAYFAIALARQGNDYLRRMLTQQLWTPESWKNLLLFNESPVSAHLWFLGALAYILVLDLALGWLFERLPARVKWGLVCVLGLGGLVMYHILTRAPEVDYPLFAYRNFLLFGLPFFLSGKLIRNSRFTDVKIPAPLYPALILLACGVTLLEYRLLGAWELYLSSIALTFLLTHLALSHPLTDPPKAVRALAWLGKNTTLAVYIVHIYFLDLLRGIYWEHLPWQYEFGVFHLIPLGVFALSLLAGAAGALLLMGVRKVTSRRPQP